MPSDGHVAIILSHTGRNERLAEIEKLLRRNGTRVVAVVSDRDSIIARYADEVLVAAGSEKVEEFWMSMFLHLVNTCWIFYMDWNLAENIRIIWS